MCVWREEGVETRLCVPAPLPSEPVRELPHAAQSPQTPGESSVSERKTRIHWACVLKCVTSARKARFLTPQESRHRLSQMPREDPGGKDADPCPNFPSDVLTLTTRQRSHGRNTGCLPTHGKLPGLRGLCLTRRAATPTPTIMIHPQSPRGHAWDLLAASSRLSRLEGSGSLAVLLSSSCSQTALPATLC